MVFRQLTSQLAGLRLGSSKAVLAKAPSSCLRLTPQRLYADLAQTAKKQSPYHKYALVRPDVEYERVKVDSVPQKTFDPYRSTRCGVIAKKKGMTCLWDNMGNQLPCTVLQIEDCQVTMVKTPETDGYLALQVGAVNVAQRKITKNLVGHFSSKGVDPKRRLVEFKVSEDAVLPVGTTFSAAHFVPGQFVDARAPSKGKGFQGGMKRHGFAGLRASHGVSLTHRSIGSTGQRAQPGKVFKGKKMPGRMGGEFVTVKNAQIIKIDVDLNLVYVKGCIPGHTEQYVTLTDAGKKWGLTKFGAPKIEAFNSASESHMPPFPTFDPAELSSFPREVMARLKEPPVYNPAAKKGK